MPIEDKSLLGGGLEEGADGIRRIWLPAIAPVGARNRSEPEPAAPEPALSARALRRIARSVLVLEEMERLRLIREGSEEDWNKALDRAERWLDGEGVVRRACWAPIGAVTR